MRRPEYAAAAVSYYKTLLKGGDATRAFHDLKCAFNRGDYTEGLGFGQKKSLLSREVQGHIGQDVGQVSLNKRGYFCKSDFVPEKGDGFKILRAGKEVGGAALSSVDKAGFYLCTNSRLKEGDRVRVTTSGAAGRQALSVKRLRPVSVALEFIAGKKPRAAAEGYVFEGEEILERAKNAPLSEEELISCFQKTDRLPFAPETAATLQDAFLQKSKLNAFRRAFYEGLSDFLISRRERLKERRVPVPSFKGETKGLCAYIAAEPMRGAGEIFICKPCEYANMRTLEGESYLYLPPFFTGEDEALISPLLEKVNGIYCEGYYGIALAKKYGKKLFAGTGFNITNRYAAAQIGEIAKHYALSKELSNRECDEIGGAGFRLAGGGIKIMDLIYCPFSLDCNHCDRKKEYALTDEENRTFPLRRYALSGSCRFEVYNCARLLDTAGGNALFDFSCGQTEGLPATKGRSERSMQ